MSNLMFRGLRASQKDRLWSEFKKTKEGKAFTFGLIYLEALEDNENFNFNRDFEAGLGDEHLDSIECKISDICAQREEFWKGINESFNRYCVKHGF